MAPHDSFSRKGEGKTPQTHALQLSAFQSFSLAHKVQRARKLLMAPSRQDTRPGAKEPASAAGADRPIFYVLRVRPHQVAKGALVRNLLLAINETHLVERNDVRGEATMHTQHACRQGRDKIDQTRFLHLRRMRGRTLRPGEHARFRVCRYDSRHAGGNDNACYNGHD